MEFPELVIEEATALREHATTEEKNNLNFNRLVPDNDYSCIYGQMTGYCFSRRASELIQKSCQKVYTAFKIPAYTTEQNLNGTPIGRERHEYWSPIEVFITGKRDDQEELNRRLIQFIKGEIKTL